MITNKAFEQTTVNLLRKYAHRAEGLGMLHPVQLKIIYKEKWFKLFVPLKWKGLQYSLPEALRLQEQLAYIDGSIGWTVTLCSGAGMFAGYLNPKIARNIFSPSKVCLGGSGAPTGTATVTKEGYMIKGFWKYATGAPHLTHFTANCIIKKNGKTLYNYDGSPKIQSFLFTKKEVIIHNDWEVMGLKATAGHSFEINNIAVDARRTFTIDTQKTMLDNAVYRYPFLAFAAATLAVNTLGMTKHLIEETNNIVKEKKGAGKLTSAQYIYSVKLIKDTQLQLENKRKKFYATVGLSWKMLISKNDIPKDMLQHVDLVSKKLVNDCRCIAAGIYPLCGTNSTETGSGINRIFRDIFTASQHTLLTYNA